jgi:hypothetical protein
MKSFAIWMEAKEPRAIYYHGTGTQYLSQILSQGIIPFPKKRTWADDPSADFHRASRASIGGIYVTTNVLTATASAWRAAKQGNSNQLIVVMELHPYSLVGDEDDFMYLANIVVPILLTTEYSAAGVYFPWKVLNTPELYALKQKSEYGESWLSQARKYVAEALSAYVEKSLQHIRVKEMHPNLLARVRDLLTKEGFGRAIERQMAYVSAYDYKRFCSDNWEEECPVGFAQPTKEVAEKRWQEFLDQITKTVKKMAVPSQRKSNFNDTGRILEPVGFSGKNKIVCIFEVLPNDRAVVIHYGTPPQRVIDDWRQKQGSWNAIEKE